MLPNRLRESGSIFYYYSSYSKYAKNIIQFAPLVLSPSNERHGGLHWLPMEGDYLPPHAMTCGHINQDMYIVRADISGSQCPGKYMKSLGIGSFPWGGREQTRGKDEIQILCGHHAKWVSTHPNNVPENAFIGGHEVSGEPLYIARAMIDDQYVCGKAFPHNNLCYFPYNGREELMSYCEVLVKSDYKTEQVSTFAAF